MVAIITIKQMKKKISICIEEDMIVRLDSKLTTGVFRSRSHLIELALAQYVDGLKKEEE